MSACPGVDYFRFPQIFPNSIIRLSDFANAMINSVLIGFPVNTLEPKDIKKLSEMKVL